MRTLSLLVTLLLLMGGHAMGQPGDNEADGATAGDSATAAPGNATTHNATAANGTASDMTNGMTNGTANTTTPAVGPECAEDDGASCRAMLWQHRMPLLRHINFIPADDGIGLRNYRVDGDLVLAELQYRPDGNLSVVARAEGHRFMLNASGDHLAFHDTNTGLILFDGSHGTVRLVLPPDANTQRTGFGARFVVDGFQVMLLSQNVSVERDGSLVVGDYFSLIKRPGELSQKNALAPTRPAAEQPLLDDALGRRHLGAEVGVDNATQIASVLTYDDLDVMVAVPKGAATQEDPIRIEVSAELSEGRAVAVTIDPARIRGEGLELRYFDIHIAADGSRVESELVFPLADSLQDALDPTNDGGQPEYWIVRDRDGIQAILVFPHWSIHAVTIAGLGEVLKPSVVVGVLAGTVAAVAAGFVLFRPRRS